MGYSADRVFWAFGGFLHPSESWVFFWVVFHFLGGFAVVFLVPPSVVCPVFFGVACFVPVWQHSSFRCFPLRTARVRTCMMTWIPDSRVTVLCRVMQVVMLEYAPWRAKQDVDGNLSFIRNVTHWHRLFCCRTVALCVHTRRWRSYGRARCSYHGDSSTC